MVLVKLVLLPLLLIIGGDAGLASPHPRRRRLTASFIVAIALGALVIGALSMRLVSTTTDMGAGLPVLLRVSGDRTSDGLVFEGWVQANVLRTATVHVDRDCVLLGPNVLHWNGWNDDAAIDVSYSSAADMWRVAEHRDPTSERINYWDEHHYDGRTLRPLDHDEASARWTRHRQVAQLAVPALLCALLFLAALVGRSHEAEMRLDPWRKSREGQVVASYFRIAGQRYLVVPQIDDEGEYVARDLQVHRFAALEASPYRDARLIHRHVLLARGQLLRLQRRARRLRWAVLATAAFLLFPLMTFGLSWSALSWDTVHELAVIGE